MESLNELIGQEVDACIGEDEEGFQVQVRCKIIDVYIDDFYFHEKGEPIYITVTALPLEKIPEGFDYESFNDISLGNITK